MGMKTRVQQIWGLWTALVALMLGGCSDPSVTECASGNTDGDVCLCPTGQIFVDGACVPGAPPGGRAPETTAVPGPGVYPGEVTVTLTADETATIFYTIDGTTPSLSSTSGPTPVAVTLTTTSDLRFFAVDDAGNQETAKSAAYTIDADAPASLSNFNAVVDNGGTVQLSWNNPTDADVESVLIVRSGGVAVTGFTPEAGAVYAVGEFVAPNVRVAYVGTAQSTADAGALAGTNHYAGYARDTAGNYGNAATTSVSAPFDNGQTATLEVRVADRQVVVTQQPNDVRLSAVGNFLQGAVSVDLTATSRSGRVLTNLKARVESISGATATSNATIDNNATVHFGLSAAIGAEVTSTLALTDLTGADPITIDLGIYSDPIMVGPGNTGQPGGFKLVDPRSGTIFEMPCDVFGPSVGQPDRCAYSGLARSPEGSTIYAGNRNSPHVIAHDPIAETTITSAALTASPIASVVGLAATPNGQHVLALLNDGSHWRAAPNPGQWVRGTSSVVLVRLNAADLTEVDRVTLMTSSDMIVGRGLAVDAGGTFAAAVVRGETTQRAFRINLANLSPTSRTFSTSPVFSSVAISDDGAIVYIAYRSGTGSGILTRWQVGQNPTNIPIPMGGTSPRAGRMRFGPDGRLYINFRLSSLPTGVWAFDTQTQMFTQITAQPARASGISPDGTRIYTIDNQNPATIRILDLSGGLLSATQLDNEFSLGRGHYCGEWIEPE